MLKKNSKKSSKMIENEKTIKSTFQNVKNQIFQYLCSLRPISATSFYK